MGVEEQHLLDVRAAHRARLNELELKAARFGTNTPPEITNEIEAIQGALETIDRAIAHPVAVQTAEDMGAGARFVAQDHKLDWVVASVKDRMDAFEQRVWAVILLSVIFSVGAFTLALAFAALVALRLW